MRKKGERRKQTTRKQNGRLSMRGRGKRIGREQKNDQMTEMVRGRGGKEGKEKGAWKEVRLIF